MHDRIWKRTGALALAMTATAVLLFSAAAFAQSATPTPTPAPPTLGADCGAGATLIGSNKAGKVTLGTNPTTCTLTFSVVYANGASCAGSNETSGGGKPVPIAVKTTNTYVMLNAYTPWSAGDQISYLCLSY